jgi:hypothetical protein
MLLFLATHSLRDINTTSGAERERVTKVTRLMKRKTKLPEEVRVSGALPCRAAR